MENYTVNSLVLQVEGVKITDDALVPLFFFFLFSYIFILLINVGIVALIMIDKGLHQPMYLIFCNLPANDIFTSSILVPRVLMDLLRPPSERLISYYECVFQAFTNHLSGTASHTVLMIMAFDRYVAICRPLRYASIMTSKMVMKLTLCAWGGAFALVAVLLALTVRLNRCRTLIANIYCDNASLFKLSCDDVSVNNLYGLSFTVVLFTGSIGSMVLTYTKITVVCLSSKSKSLNRKAFQTCSSHLFLYLIFSLTGLLIIILHRFPQLTELRKLAVIVGQIVTCTLNPIIYGVQCQEIRTFTSKLLRPRNKLFF